MRLFRTTAKFMGGTMTEATIDIDSIELICSSSSDNVGWHYVYINGHCTIMISEHDREQIENILENKFVMRSE